MGFLSRILGNAGRPAPASPGDGLATAAARFAEWLSSGLGRSVPTRADGWGALDEVFADPTAFPNPTDAMLDDAAAWLGEGARASLGGAWREDPVLGLVVADLGGIGHLRLRVHDVATKKLELRAGLNLASFAGRIPERIRAERLLPPPVLPTPEAIAELCASDPADAADRCARALAADWKSRLGAELPQNLRGLREVDRRLRTHYLICGTGEPDWLCAGFLVGEVARGLFGGTWVRQQDPVRATLRFPELDYQPVGRIFRMMTELPEGEPLEEYVRVIPSARAELRGRD